MQMTPNITKQFSRGYGQRHATQCFKAWHVFDENGPSSITGPAHAPGHVQEHNARGLLAWLGNVTTGNDCQQAARVFE